MPKLTHFICPICKSALYDNEKSLVCENSHCFDIAKGGYVNLLPPNKMHAKCPGDNKQMVQNRTEFLSKGYYSKLKDAISLQTVKYAFEVSANKSKGTVLDVGCGEGYYTSALSAIIKHDALQNIDVCGIDISKEALKAACRRDKSVSYAVSSVFSLPIENESVDILTEVFAPFQRNEFYRVLNKDGILLLVIPDENHLMSMKKAVYDNPYKNDVKSFDIEGFSLIEKISVKDEIFIDNKKDIESLFLMTPYAYKTSIENTNRLMALDTLKTETEFLLLCYSKI